MFYHPLSPVVDAYRVFVPFSLWFLFMARQPSSTLGSIGSSAREGFKGAVFNFLQALVPLWPGRVYSYSNVSLGYAIWNCCRFLLVRFCRIAVPFAGIHILRVSFLCVIVWPPCINVLDLCCCGGAGFVMWLCCYLLNCGLRRLMKCYINEINGSGTVTSVNNHCVDLQMAVWLFAFACGLCSVMTATWLDTKSVSLLYPRNVCMHMLFGRLTLLAVW